MVIIKSEGKFNDNSYLIDGMLFRMSGNLAIYVIENNGTRMMIDTSEELMAKKIVDKLKEFNIYPIHKLLLTHSHWDHVQGVAKLKKLMKETEIEVLASEDAIDNLRNTERMNKIFGYKVNPVDDVIPLKDGDNIDLNGLKLEIFNFFGHTQDSIALLDRKNRNIFTGDAIIDRYDYDTVSPTFFPPDFNEIALFKTFKKLKSLKNNIDSISLAHFGVWKGGDFEKILSEMESLHKDAKESIIKWYKEKPSIEHITLKYHEKFTPNSKIHTKENMIGLHLIIEWLVKGLQISGFIK